MANFVKNSENFTALSCLYRVWVPLHDGGKVPLVAIWIDPTMSAFEPQPQQEVIALPDAKEAVMADQLEDPTRCLVGASTAIEVVAVRTPGELNC
jgi:hypothetical protein